MYCVLICTQCEYESKTQGEEEKLKETRGYSTGQRVYMWELTLQCMGMSGTPPEVTHREGILLDVAMNRKPSQPPWTHPGLWCQGVTRSPGSYGGGHSYPKRLATSPCHTEPEHVCGVLCPAWWKQNIREQDTQIRWATNYKFLKYTNSVSGIIKKEANMRPVIDRWNLCDFCSVTCSDGFPKT